LNPPGSLGKVTLDRISHLAKIESNFQIQKQEGKMSSSKWKGVLALVFSAGIFIASQGLAADTVKIVHIDPFSGPFKDVGDRHYMGVQFAVDEINSQGGLLGKKWSSSARTVS
jgi:ABC-type branched-subunit amino acid transport system substrate-binding protein